MPCDYTDEELRMTLLPTAMKFVDQEIYRITNQCNTSTVAGIVKELVNIVRYGTVAEPEAINNEALSETTVEPATTTYGG